MTILQERFLSVGKPGLADHVIRGLQPMLVCGRETAEVGCMVGMSFVDQVTCPLCKGDREHMCPCQAAAGIVIIDWRAWQPVPVASS